MRVAHVVAAHDEARRGAVREAVLRAPGTSSLARTLAERAVNSRREIDVMAIKSS